MSVCVFLFVLVVLYTCLRNTHETNAATNAQTIATNAKTNDTDAATNATTIATNAKINEHNATTYATTDETNTGRAGGTNATNETNAANASPHSLIMVKGCTHHGGQS